MTHPCTPIYCLLTSNRRTAFVPRRLLCALPPSLPPALARSLLRRHGPSDRASDPLAMIHGVLETHINSSLANANVTVSMGTPRFTALGDGTFGTFPYQMVAAGERCGSARAATTGTSISDLLPTFRQGNPALFATSTLLIALEYDGYFMHLFWGGFGVGGGPIYHVSHEVLAYR